MSFCEFLYKVVGRPAPIRRLINHLILAFLPRSVRIGGAEILLNPQDPVVSGALAMGVYEKEEINLFSKTIRPGMTVVDVGANLGAYSAVALDRLRGRGELLAVEPAAENYVWLERNLRRNRRTSPGVKIQAVQAALSDKTGFALLHKNPANKGDNRLYRDRLLQGQERVKVLTLDALCRQKKIRSIDVLKIDVQGFESRVLAGARKILAASPHCHLFCEFWADAIRKANDKPEKVFRILEKAGFALYEYDKKRMIPLRRDRSVQRTLGRNYINLYARRSRIGKASRARQ